MIVNLAHTHTHFDPLENLK